MHDPTVSRPLAPLYRVFLFGRFRIQQRDAQGIYRPLQPGKWDRQSPQRVLAYLLVTPGRHTLRDTLLDALCPDDELDRAQATLSQALSLIRHVLVDEQGYPLLLPRKATPQKPLVLAGREQIWCDWDAFEDTLMQAQAAEQQGKDALPVWEQAYALCQEEFLLEERYSDWCREVRERAEGDQRLCLLHLAACYEQQERRVDAERMLRAWLSTHALDQDALCRLMEVLAEQGRMQEALSWYQRTCEVLQEEGEEPDQRTLETIEFVRASQSQRKPRRVQNQFEQPLSLSLTSQQENHDAIASPASVVHATESWVLPLSPGSILIPASEIEARQPFSIPSPFHSLEDEPQGTSSSLFALGVHLLALAQQQETSSFQEFFQRIELALENCKEVLQTTYSRRQAIALLASLSAGLLRDIRTTHSWAAEDTLTLCSAGVIACWNLFWEGDFSEVEKSLPIYLARLAPLTQYTTSFQMRAASLLSQAHQIASLLVLERQDYGAALAHCKQAFFYGELAGDPNLQVAALIRQANVHFYQKRPEQILHTYQQAMEHLNLKQVSSLLCGRVYSGLSAAQAQLGQKQEALRFAGLAHEVFPACPEADPAFLYTNTTRYILHFNDANTYLYLNQPQQAWAALQQAATFVPHEVTPRGMELQNHRALISIALKELEQSVTHFERLVKSGKILGSNLHQNEARGIYDYLYTQWPREQLVKELKSLLSG